MWRALPPFPCLSCPAIPLGSGRGTAKGLDFDVSISNVRAPLKGSQSCGGESMPQILPGDSNSTAVWKRPVGSFGRSTHFTRPRAETGGTFGFEFFNSRTTSAFVKTWCLDKYLKPWQLMATVETSSLYGPRKESTPSTFKGMACSTRVLRRTGRNAAELLDILVSQDWKFRINQPAENGG